MTTDVRARLAFAAALSFLALALSPAAQAEVSAARGASVDPGAMARAFPEGGLVPAKAGEAQVIAARDLAAKTLGEDTRDLVFVPITPCTVWDTRFATGAPFAGAIGDGVTRKFYSHLDSTGGDFTVEGGNPSCTEANQSFLGVRPFAVMMTIYVNNPTGEGWLTFYRDGDPDPSQATISVFYSPGPTRTQTVISKSSRGYGTGTYDIAVTGRFATADASASVVGYFVKTTNNITLPQSTATTGNIMKGGVNRFIHNYGAFDTFIGENAGNFTLTGGNNTGSGYAGLTSNTTGNYNTAGGVNSLRTNTTGSSNTTSGTSALYSSYSGGNNTASGVGAIYANLTGSNNTANGRVALTSNILANSNTANGYGALQNNAVNDIPGGNSNTASGALALSKNNTGNSNTASGDEALQNNQDGTNNTAIGMKALTVPPPTFVGYSAGPPNLHDGNIAVGYYAGSQILYYSAVGGTGGSYDIAIGNAGVYPDANTIRIGDSANHTRTFIAGVRGITTGVNDAVTLFIDSAGQLGTLNSSRRFKDDIADMGEASSALMKLRPVTFHYKSDQDAAGRRLQYGLIAEEVDKVYPGLVSHSADGQVETVMYQFLPAMLLSEYQKRQRTIETQAAMAKQETERIAELDQDRKARVARIAELEKQAANVAALDEDRQAQAAEVAALKQLTAKIALELDRLQHTNIQQ